MNLAPSYPVRVLGQSATGQPSICSSDPSRSMPVDAGQRADSLETRIGSRDTVKLSSHQVLTLQLAYRDYKRILRLYPPADACPDYASLPTPYRTLIGLPYTFQVGKQLITHYYLSTELSSGRLEFFSSLSSLGRTVTVRCKPMSGTSRHRRCRSHWIRHWRLSETRNQRSSHLVRKFIIWVMPNS